MDYLNFAQELARAAGEVLTYHASRDKHVAMKGHADLVTVADRESEALIVGEIRRCYPGHTILTEEAGLLESATAESPGRWLIDPLDGTTNYAHQYPMYSVSIAFERENERVCGVVFDPVRDEMFTGLKDGGAFLNGVPINVSEVSSLAAGLLVTGFPYEFRKKVGWALGLFREFLIRSQAVRRAGSAALDLCYLASGRCDGFWELDLKPWDTAAGALILQEAGGQVTDFSARPYRLESGEILASNGRIHSEMLAAISAVQR